MILEGSDHRQTARGPVLLQARCRKSSWSVFPVEVGNISNGGCSIFGNTDKLGVDEMVQLTFASLKGIVADVRWLGSNQAGIEFRDPLEDHVVEELRRTYGLVSR
ncbi:PilZ domain-containing protein [Novosphingobium panipatense]|uniref:PilZ domain-containing protein n=1 Tax=Novosphingobium panipatense TaxID=428991 RepID=A0ABY1Q3D5_9SPHN|nr:PilZ domain-containing protein [Novosphingobium panipatense]SMP58037.1 PilZ domain-containing protein [Novosphingobium panipatense]